MGMMYVIEHKAFNTFIPFAAFTWEVACERKTTKGSG